MKGGKVLIFSLAYQPFIGGAEVAVREITKRLPDFEFEMITVNLDGAQKREEKIGNVLVRRITGKYLYPLRALRLATKLHQQRRYDVVWAIMANQAGMAAAAFKRKFPAVEFLLTLQEGDELSSWTYRLRLFGPRLWQVLAQADRIQVISNYLADWARVMGARCPIEVIPNGVDINKFKVESLKLKVRDHKSKTIITTGRLVKKNGVDDLIKSLQFLDPEIKLDLLGGGVDEAELRQLVADLKLENRVRFLGHVPPEQVAEYLAGADVFVRASRSEGLGNSFLEAMAASVPVVGTNIGGIPDFLHDPGSLDTECLLRYQPRHSVSRPQTGWFCRVNNPASIAKQVKFILNPTNAEKVQAVKAAARKLVEERYDWPAITVKMGYLLS